jgi:hypothetical protein
MTGSSAPTESFIARWQGQEGGQERANYALFLSELCDVLGVGRPAPAAATTDENDYVFERAVRRPAIETETRCTACGLWDKRCRGLYSRLVAVRKAEAGTPARS